MVNPPPNLPPLWNVAPTDKATVVRLHPETGERRLDALAGELVPHFTSDLKAARRPINVRSETADNRRVLTPASMLLPRGFNRLAKDHPRHRRGGPQALTPYARPRKKGTYALRVQTATAF